MSPQRYLRLLTVLYACTNIYQLKFSKKANLEVAVRGGGHSASGASSTEGGLVIDLCKMRKVKVDTSKNIIIAQGGALWADVDTAAAEHGLATGTIFIITI